MPARLAALVLSLGLLVACGDDADDAGAPADRAAESATPRPSPTPSGSPSPTPSAAPGTRIVVGPSDYGSMLFDATGQAIYLFDVETSTRPRCYDACAEAWPPVLTRGEPVAGRGLDPARLGTVERADGAVQVTYGGHPLYFYAHEAKREVLCHDVYLNGGNWYVVQPDGSAAPPG